MEPKQKFERFMRESWFWQLRQYTRNQLTPLVDDRLDFHNAITAPDHVGYDFELAQNGTVSRITAAEKSSGSEAFDSAVGTKLSSIEDAPALPSNGPESVVFTIIADSWGLTGIDDHAHLSSALRIYFGTRLSMPRREEWGKVSDSLRTLAPKVERSQRVPWKSLEEWLVVVDAQGHITIDSHFEIAAKDYPVRDFIDTFMEELTGTTLPLPTSLPKTCHLLLSLGEFGLKVVVPTAYVPCSEPLSLRRIFRQRAATIAAAQTRGERILSDAERDPTNVKLLLNSADILWTDDTEEALRRIRRAIEIAPMNPEPYSRYAFKLLTLAKKVQPVEGRLLDEIISNYRKAFELRAGTTILDADLQNMAHAYALQGDVKAALAVLKDEWKGATLDDYVILAHVFEGRKMLDHAVVVLNAGLLRGTKKVPVDDLEQVFSLLMTYLQQLGKSGEIAKQKQRLERLLEDRNKPKRKWR